VIVFGAFASLSGLLVLLLRDAPLGGLGPATVGWVMIALGLVSAAVGAVLHRRKRAKGVPGPVGNPVQRAKALPRLFKAWRGGRYPELPRSQVALWATALVYLVSPIDLVPELLPVIGVTDDAGVVVWLLSSLSVASGTFLRWEKDHRDPARGIEAP
jgi:uncharacterized membrane protein YkvA (DUF1232 family)